MQSHVSDVYMCVQSALAVFMVFEACAVQLQSGIIGFLILSAFICMIKF